MQTNKDQTSAFITVVGRPNVGKSSFLNAAVGQKVAIVSDKPQTTRTRIMGVLTKDVAQLVFIDTPGFHKPRNRLGESMVKAVSSGMSGVDAAVLIVEASPKFKLDPKNMPSAELGLISELKVRKIKTVLVINKIDLLERHDELLPVINAYRSLYDFESIVPFSAKTGEGMDSLMVELMKFAKPSPHHFEDDSFTDQPERVMVAEIIREKLLRLLSEEIPHGIAVDLERFFERDNTAGEPLLEVEAIIYCERESHKGIIIGKKGALLKRVGTEARIEIEEFFGCKVNVTLWVKVKEDWRNRQGIIHSFGLD